MATKFKSQGSSADRSTEEKIMHAARILFQRKGFAATRTRDIAEEAGINLALLNYYFRSKQKLFDLIMLESLQDFFRNMQDVFNNEQTSLYDKIDTYVTNYIDFLILRPDIPIFILSELRSHPKELISKMNMKEFLMKSYFIRQFQKEVRDGRISPMHPLHFLMNLAGLIVFPFIGNPVIKNLGNLRQEEFDQLMMQRKTLIPKWIKAMLKVR